MAIKLLIVDDEADITESLKQYFVMKGFAVSTASTAEEAFVLLGNEKPDIVILDMLLKGKLDGIDVLRDSRKISPGSKIIMLTGSDTPAKEEEARQLGVTRYLKKPIRPRELSDIINEVLEKK